MTVYVYNKMNLLQDAFPVTWTRNSVYNMFKLGGDSNSTPELTFEEWVDTFTTDTRLQASFSEDWAMS